MDRLDTKSNLELAKTYQSEVERVYGSDAAAMVDPSVETRSGMPIITPIEGLAEGGWRKYERTVVLRHMLISVIAGLRQLASQDAT